MAKLTGLEEVKADARFNYMQRLAVEKAKRDYEASKHTSPADEPVEDKKGK